MDIDIKQYDKLDLQAGSAVKQSQTSWLYFHPDH